MNYQQINLIRKNYKKLIFQNSLQESEIEQIVQNQKYNQYIQIENKLIDKKSLVVVSKVRCLTDLLGLDISFISNAIETQNSMLQLIQSLQFLKNLQYLYLSFEQMELDMSIFSSELGNSLTYLSNLKLFSLKVVKIQEFTPEGSKAIGVGIQSLNSLESLIFHFLFSSKQVNLETLKNLFISFKEQNNLKTFELTIGGHFRLNDEGLKVISDNLYQLNSLQRLKFCSGEGVQITNIGIEYLKQAIQSLKNLQSTALTLKTKIGAKCLLELLDILLASENQEEISFNAITFEKPGESYEIGKYTNPNSKLKKFLFDLTNVSIDIENPILFNKNMRYLQKLENFNVFIFDYQIDSQLKQQEQIELIQNQYCMKQIQIFYENKIKISTILNLWVCLLNLKQLKKLDLYLILIISEDFNEVKQLSQIISSLEQLEELYISLESDDLTLDHSKEIISSLKKLQNLKVLELYILNKHKREDDILSLIGEYIIYLKQLEFLSLHYTCKVNQQNSSKLANCLKQLQNLKSLELNNIFHLQHMNKEQGQYFISVLDQNTNIYELTLKFEFDSDSDAFLTNILLQNLLKLSKLRILDIVRRQNMLSIYHLNFQRDIKRKLIRLVQL